MNGMKIRGKKKKNIPNWNKIYDIVSETAAISIVNGQPDHRIIIVESL
jgi:hypothetical protein